MHEMIGQIQTLLALLLVLSAVAVVARRLDIAPSILLVVAGVLLALVPGLPRIELAPEVVLLILLPPLIYSAGVAMSWREFRHSLRPITLLAFGCVVFTAGAVAVGMNWAFGLPWPRGFLLGAIVAPPDVVAPLAIARRLGVPHRVLVILEGEGLANDATALIIYRFAVIAIVTGTFSFPKASGIFGLIVVGEIAYGIGIGWLSLLVRTLGAYRLLEIVLSLLTPYIAYWIPEHVGGSGVLATVAAGLYVSWRGPLLISSATRLQGFFFWNLIVYVIEGFVFLITGLQARSLIEHATFEGWRRLLLATLLTSAIVILARFIWVFPATYLPRLIPSLRRRDPAPPWQIPFVIGFIGVRGVVSLAAALAIPLTLANGDPFPARDLILFIAFGVIIVTLVGIGLTLPWVVRWLGLNRTVELERQRESQAEHAARFELIEAALARLETLVAERKLPEPVVDTLRAHFDSRRRQFPRQFNDGDGIQEASLTSALRLELIDLERVHLHRLLREGKISDEVRRHIERELDLDEATVVFKGERGSELPV
jgi:CPA1 family monovalent cation:H+ antiporter